MTDVSASAESGLYLKLDGEIGTIRLRTFLSVLGNALDALAAVDSGISKTATGSVDWYVTDLKVASLGAVVMPRPKRNQTTEFVPSIQQTYVAGLRQLQTGEGMPPYFTDYALKKIDSAAQRLAKEDVGGLHVEDLPRHEAATVNVLTHAAVTKILAPVYRGIGSVTGTLEMINLHGTPTFNVYERRSKRAVRCKFSDQQKEAIKAALGHPVIVRGIVNRNAKGDPVSVERVEVEVITPAGHVPASTIFGIDPDFTGSETSVEYLARLRDG